MTYGRAKACTHLLLLLLGFGLLALPFELSLSLLDLALARALFLCRRPLPFGLLALLPFGVFELGLPKLFELLLAFALLPGGFRLPFLGLGLGLGLGLLLLHLLLAVPLQSLLFLLGFACLSLVLVQGPLLARRPWRRDAPLWLRLRFRLGLGLRFRLRLWLRLGL
eukprot:COSAG04_NODE_382_length_15412_cov_4.959992_5_plen_166_part_00